MKKLFAMLCALGLSPALALAEEPQCEGCEEGGAGKKVELQVKGERDGAVRILGQLGAEPDERLVEALHRIHAELRKLNQRVDQLEQGRQGQGHGDGAPGGANGRRQARPERPDGPNFHDRYFEFRRPQHGLPGPLPRMLPHLLPFLKQFNHGDAHAFIQRLHHELQRRCQAGECPLEKLMMLLAERMGHARRMQDGQGPDIHRFLQRALRDHGLGGPGFDDDGDDDDDRDQPRRGEGPRRKKVQQPRRDGHRGGQGHIRVPDDLQALFPEGVDLEELLNEAWPELQQDMPEGSGQMLQQALKNWKQVMRQQGIEPEMAREYLRGVDPKDLEGLKAMLPSLLKRFKNDPRFKRAQEDMRRAHGDRNLDRDGIQHDDDAPGGAEEPENKPVTTKRYL